MVYPHMRVLGQQLNPLLTILPLGVLGSAVLSDLGALVSGSSFFARVAYWDLSVGLLVGVVSLSVLLVDLITAPAGSPIRRVLGAVSVANCAMVILFAMLWSIRGDANPAAGVGMFIVELVALGAGIAGAWLARTLVVDQPEPVPAPVPVTVPGRGSPFLDF